MHTHINCSDCPSRNGSVFCTLKKMALDQLSTNKITNTYKKGQALFYEGNPPFGLYCIKSGKVKLTKSGVNGEETIVRLVKAGDLLGHRSLFTDTPYAASAVALEDSTICFINKNIIMKLIQENPDLTFKMLANLSNDMGAAENWIASLSQKNIRERFAELLLLLKESFGKKVNGKIQLDIKLTREEMASMVGTASESLIRLITEFKDDGLIDQMGKNLIILNEEKILEYAGLTH